MKRKRIGCDLCKQDHPTFVFQHPGSHLVLWFCPRCYEVLTGRKP
jgi:hypothetical protein